MARPKKEKSYEKSNRVTVRFTDAEMKEIQEKSGKLNMSVSEYIRERVNRGKVEYLFNRNRVLDDVMPLTEEFHKIGINLNQTAHHLNGGGGLIMRENFRIEAIDAHVSTFDAECRQLNRAFHKNLSYDDIKSHHYIISFDPKDSIEGELTLDDAQRIGMDFARRSSYIRWIFCLLQKEGLRRRNTGRIYVENELTDLNLISPVLRSAPTSKLYLTIPISTWLYEPPLSMKSTVSSSFRRMANFCWLMAVGQGEPFLRPC